MSDIARVAGVLAWDRAAAGALVDALPAPRRIESTPLMRSATKLAKSLTESFLAHTGPARKQAEPAWPANHLRGESSANPSGTFDDTDPAPEQRVTSAAVSGVSRPPVVAQSGGAS